MAAPSIVGGYTEGGLVSNATTQTVTVPTYTNGDKIYVVWATDGDSATATISGSGWTVLEGPRDIESTTVPNAGVMYIWYRTASSEPASYTVTSTVSERSLYVAFAVTGDNGIDAEGTYASAADSSAEVTDVTSTQANTLRISAVVSIRSPLTISTLGGHTLLATHSYSSAGTISVQWKTLTASGLDAGQTATLSAGGWGAHAWAIKPVTGGGSAYNQSAAGSLTPAGAIIRSTTKKPAGSITPTGALVRRAGKVLAGALTPSGAIVRQTVKKVAGILTPTGAAIKMAVKALAGSITPTGALVKQQITLYLQSVAGSLTPSGALTRRTNKLVSGMLTPAGGIFKQIGKVLAGVLGLAGALVRQAFDFDQADVTLTDAAVTVCSLVDAAVTTITLTDSAVTNITISDATT